MKDDKLKKSGMYNYATPIIFNNAAKLRENMTETELILWEELRKKPMGFKFRRQHPINRFILDFYCHKLRLSIEIDGGYHLSEAQKQKDNNRSLELNDLGIKEIRFTNNEVKNNLSNVMSTIFDELRAGSL